jgi:hypothetical protein
MEKITTHVVHRAPGTRERARCRVHWSGVIRSTSSSVRSAARRRARSSYQPVTQLRRSAILRSSGPYSAKSSSAKTLTQRDGPGLPPERASMAPAVRKPGRRPTGGVHSRPAPRRLGRQPSGVRRADRLGPATCRQAQTPLIRVVWSCWRRLRGFAVTSVDRTAHPRFGRVVSGRELAESFTPTDDEAEWARARTAQDDRRLLALVVWLKSYQRPTSPTCGRC